MFTVKRLIGGSLFVLVLAANALAQQSRAPVDTPREPVAAAAPLVAATATAKRVRFVSPGTVVQLRLEVFNEEGQKLFDTEQRGGNVLDWHLQDGAGERLPAGSYACVLTIKNLSGRISQRIGLVVVNDTKATIEAASAGELSMAQQQAIGPIAGPVEGSAGFSVLQQSEAEAITAVTHDGTQGQLSRTRGPLSFRVGDVFTGKDEEQMRITENGSVGIGTRDPQAKLDVAGTIRGERFVIAKPISKQGQPGKGSSDNQRSATAELPDEQPLATGSGTLNKVPKWTETGGAGTLGDSAITEVSGNVGINAPTPGGQLHIGGIATQDLFAGMGTDLSVGPAFNFGYAGESFGRGAGFFNVRPDASATAPNPSLRFMTTNVERMIITNTGNIGIGASNPLRTLQIGPSINALFTFSPSDGTPNAGFIRFGDQTGWKLYIGRNREVSLGALNTGTTGVLMTIQDNGRVGIGTTTPSALLQVAGHMDTNSLFVSNGLSVYVDNQPEQASPLCISTANFRVGYCSSSLRYKKDLTPFAGGLDLINRLRPVSFTWKRNGAQDIGLAAEEVEEVEPLLTFRNGKGEIEGVRYNQLSAVFINAFKEQQAQIGRQQKEITQLRESDAALRARLRAIEKALKNNASRSLRRR